MLVNFFGAAGGLRRAGCFPRAYRRAARPLRPCAAPSGKPFAVSLVDVAAEVGLRARFVNGDEKAKRYIIEANGTGVAFVDFDNDGWDDIFLVNGSRLDGSGAGGNYLFRNQRGKFVDVTKQAGVERAGMGQRGVRRGRG